MEDKVATKIVPAGLLKETLSVLLDLALAIGLMVGIYFALGKPVFIDHGTYQTALAQRQDYLGSSLLVEKKENDNYGYYLFTDRDDSFPEDYAYKKYIDVVWDYFAKVIPGNADYSSNLEITSARTGKKLPGFGSEVTSLTPEYGKYIYENYFGYVDEGENSFVPSVENDFTSKPKANKDEVEFHKALAAEMWSTSSGSVNGHYYDAVTHLTYQPRLAAIQSVMAFQSYVATVPSIFIGPLIFFFLIPLFVPHGRTLGKLLLGTIVLDEKGAVAKKKQILFRQAIITTIFFVAAIPIRSIAFPAVVILGFIAYISRIMSKSTQSLHDKLAHTIVALKKESVYAESADEIEAVEEEPEKNENESMSPALLAQIEREESILDLSTINKRREEARRMTSFDEFEKESDAKYESSKEEEEDELSPEEQEELRLMAKLEGASEEEIDSLIEKGDIENPDEDVHDDGFVDEDKN